MRNNHTNHRNHPLFASHKLTGSNKQQTASWNLCPLAPACSTLEPEVFWCTTEMCIVQNHQASQAGDACKCETVLREPERSPLSPAGSASCGLPSWAWWSCTDSLRNVCPQKQGSLSCLTAASAEQGANKHVWLSWCVNAHRECVCYVESDCACWREQRYCAFSFAFVRLFIYMCWLGLVVNVVCACVCVCVHFFACFSVCVCSPVTAEDRLRQQLEMGWQKHEEQPCALHKQRNSFDKDIAMARHNAASQCFQTSQELNIIWWRHRLCNRAGQTTTEAQHMA